MWICVYGTSKLICLLNGYLYFTIAFNNCGLCDVIDFLMTSLQEEEIYFALQWSELHFCHMSSLTEQEQEASQRDGNVNVSDAIVTATNDATDEGRESQS